MSESQVSSASNVFANLMRESITLTTGKGEFSVKENRVIEGAVSDGVVTSNEFYEDFSYLRDCNVGMYSSRNDLYSTKTDYRLCLSKPLFKRIVGDTRAHHFTVFELSQALNRLKRNLGLTDDAQSKQRPEEPDDGFFASLMRQNWSVPF